MKSQVYIFGLPEPKTWAEYRRGALATFHGGYHNSEKLSAFQHGMNTIFNLLESEFQNMVSDADKESAYRRGQRDMRERAAEGCEDEARLTGHDKNWRFEVRGCNRCASHIRALPDLPPPEEVTK